MADDGFSDILRVFEQEPEHSTPKGGRARRHSPEPHGRVAGWVWLLGGIVVGIGAYAAIQHFWPHQKSKSHGTATGTGTGTGTATPSSPPLSPSPPPSSARATAESASTFRRSRAQGKQVRFNIPEVSEEEVWA